MSLSETSVEAGPYLVFEPGFDGQFNMPLGRVSNRSRLVHCPVLVDIELEDGRAIHTVKLEYPAGSTEDQAPSRLTTIDHQTLNYLTGPVLGFYIGLAAKDPNSVTVFDDRLVGLPLDSRIAARVRPFLVGAVEAARKSGRITRRTAQSRWCANLA